MGSINTVLCAITSLFSFLKKKNTHIFLHEDQSKVNYSDPIADYYYCLKADWWIMQKFTSKYNGF